jgi:hypothetical protein
MSYAIPVILMLASLYPLTTGYFFSHQGATSATGVDVGRLIESAQTDNFLAYRTAVMRYAELNPGVTGTVANTSLPLPLGFTSLGAWTNTLTATTAYVYSSTGAEGEILSAQPEAPWLRDWIAGYNQGGTWVTGNGIGLALPGYIPNGSVVAVIQR